MSFTVLLFTSFSHSFCTSSTVYLFGKRAKKKKKKEKYVFVKTVRDDTADRPAVVAYDLVE